MSAFPVVTVCVVAFLGLSAAVASADDSADAAARGGDLFTEFCQGCHGENKSGLLNFSRSREELQLILEGEDFDWDRTSPSYTDNLIAPFMTEDKDLGRLTLVGSMMSAVELKTLMVKVLDLGTKHFKDVAVLEPAGYVPLYIKIIDYVIDSQIQSLVYAILVIFIIMLIWTRSLRCAQNN